MKLLAFALVLQFSKGGDTPIRHKTIAIDFNDAHNFVELKIATHRNMPSLACKRPLAARSYRENEVVRIARGSEVALQGETRLVVNAR